MNLPTWGPSANCSKLLVSDTINFCDQNTCFLTGDLVFAWFWSDCLYISWKNRGQVSLKNLKALEQRYWLNLSETRSQLIFDGVSLQFDFCYQAGDEAVSNTSVLGSLQFTFQFLIPIWIPSWAGIIKMWLN